MSKREEGREEVEEGRMEDIVISMDLIEGELIVPRGHVMI